ncbi:MAG: MgtC/SapB family protein [Muribaculaceae bacterium]|nr:MgtC/SapB family protein [Muribaculaceae bacterium]MDE5972493.1 MgtC/SapB family protein [Muribaculaceae bacterium]MDE6461753.1 MgtC/SapB family protein [Muribaculaceae bacterium]
MNWATQLWLDMTAVEISTAQAIFKLFVSLTLGSIVGYERKRKGQPAGLRTFALISMGATLAMIVSIYICQAYMGLKNGDPGRIAAQVITGVGFLGAGAIIQMKGSVRGLTTAAGIWMVSTIGLAVGVGLYLLSITATLLILIILVTLEGVERRHAMGSESRIIRMKVRAIVTDIEPYRTVLSRHDVRLVNEYVDYDYVEHTTRLNLIVLSRESLNYIKLFGELSALLPTDSITLSNQLQ